MTDNTIHPEDGRQDVRRFGDDVTAALNRAESAHPEDTSSPVAVRTRMNAFRDVLSQAHKRIEALHDSGASGREVCRLITETADRCVVHAYRLVFGDSPPSLSVFALGGYGRRELNPRSDIDILCLVPETAAGAFDTGVAAMFQFLWDMNFDLGHSTRNPSECIAAAREDGDLATSLLEARLLVGDAGLADELRTKIATFLAGNDGKNLAMQKIEERLRRHDLFHNTVQIQQPNIKESPGGLRDIHVVRWLVAITGSGGTVADLAAAGFLEAREARALEEHFDFLLRVRSSLHFLSGKNADLLDHLILPDTARHAGYTGEGAGPVEQLMHDYFKGAGMTRRLTGRIVADIGDRLNDVTHHPRSVVEGKFLANDNRIGLTPDAISSLSEHPEVVVRLFALAGKRALDLDPAAAAAVERVTAGAPQDFCEDRAVRKAFQAMVNSKAAVALGFRLMHEYGVLTVLIPEFSGIGCHYQYDYYHAYTTDEHSLRVVEHLEHMARRTHGMPADLADIMRDVTARGALYLAGLLHDIGKCFGHGHAHRGEQMAARALRRLGFDDRTIRLVRFLIAEHLLLSHISQRRDMDDDETIADLADHVGSTGRLRMLTLLTFADLMALSEGALTDWKKALLRNLYHTTLVYLERGFEHRDKTYRSHAVDAVIRRLDDLPADVVRHHLDILPKQYVRTVTTGDIRRHIRGVESIKRKSAWASFEHRGDMTVLTVIAADFPRALADICGVITASDINIVGARIFTREDGVIIDSFLVMNGTGESLISKETQREFKNAIGAVVRGESEVEDLLVLHRSRWKRRRRNAVFAPPRVRVDNTVSSHYTILDVFATDYTGLLYDITSVLAAHDIDIHTAKIGTDEDQVLDAFYLQQRGGGKITDTANLDHLTASIIARIEAAYS